MDKKDLEELTKLRAEEKDLQLRLDKFDRKPKISIDGVRGSSKEFPYIQHNCKIEGIDSRSRNQLKKMIKSCQKKIVNKIKKVEYELNKIEDSELRQIIRYKYEDNLSWIQIMYKMNYTSEDVARKKLKKFLIKN